MAQPDVAQNALDRFIQALALTEVPPHIIEQLEQLLASETGPKSDDLVKVFLDEDGPA